MAHITSVKDIVFDFTAYWEGSQICLSSQSTWLQFAFYIMLMWSWSWSGWLQISGLVCLETDRRQFGQRTYYIIDSILPVFSVVGRVKWRNNDAFSNRPGLCEQDVSDFPHWPRQTHTYHSHNQPKTHTHRHTHIYIHLYRDWKKHLQN